MSAEEVCGAKALATELFDAGQVVTGAWHLPSMLTRDVIDEDLADAMAESGHPILAFIAESEDVSDYHHGLDRGAVPVWLVDVEGSNGVVISGVGDTFGGVVAAARLALVGENS